MNQPTAMTRLIGRPRVASTLYVGYALVVLGWWAGDVPWWLAIAAVSAAGTTREAVRRVRNYNDWWAAWQSMGGISEAAPPRRQKTPKRGWVLAVEALGFALVALAILAYVPAGTKPPDTLLVLWFSACVGFVWKLFMLLRYVVSRPKKAAAPNRKKTKAPDVVEWVLPRPSSSPSRHEAERNLPVHFKVQHLPSVKS